MRKYLYLLGACLAVGLVSVLPVASASATTVENVTAKSALLAVYGNPPERAVAGEPIGGGIGRNFGFGENMLFQASTAAKVGENLDITLGGLLLEAGDTYLGGTLTSNKTPVIKVGTVEHESPVSFAIQFVDFQENVIGTAKEKVASYADTYDRPWISEICGSKANCLLDPRGAEGAHLVEIQDVSFSVGPGTVVQGTAWGLWENGTTTTPACIKLTKPPAGFELDNLFETQGGNVGAHAETFSGKACLISANNDYPPKTNAITAE